MAIIVEGFDNSGKSTLARSLGFEVLHPGPRPKSLGEEYDCFVKQLDQARKPVVMDRVTCISTPCYTSKDWQNYAHWVRRMTEMPHCVIIYCRPPIEAIKDFSRHICKGYDEAKHVQWLIDNAERVVDNYDLYMSQVPHMKYDYTDPNRVVIQMAQDAQFTIRGWNAWQAETQKRT